MGRTVVINHRIYPKCTQTECFGCDAEHSACLILEKRCDRADGACPFFVTKKQRKANLAKCEKRLKGIGGKR